MTAADGERWLAVIRSHRWAALATQGAEGPEAFWVAFAVELDGSFLLHLSRLAAHTRNLLQDPRAGLAVSEREHDDGSDPQQLARVSIQGRVQVLTRDTPTYAAAAESYRARLPASASLFDFPDFVLFRLEPERLRFIGGFAQAWTLDGDAFRKLMVEHAGNCGGSPLLCPSP